jgi:hypothetical protein
VRATIKKGRERIHEYSGLRSHSSAHVRKNRSMSFSTTTQMRPSFGVHQPAELVAVTMALFT